MIFEHPWLLFLLLLALPVAWLWMHSVRRRKERINRFSESAFAEKLLLGNNPSARLWHFILFASGTVLLIISLCGPMLVGGKEKVKSTGIDVMVVLDVS